MAGGHGEKLTRWQDVAIACLLSEPSIKRAAKKAGLDESTLRGWLKLPGFAAAYRQARRQVVEQAVGRRQRASGKAVGTLAPSCVGARPPTASGPPTCCWGTRSRGWNRWTLLSVLRSWSGCCGGTAMSLKARVRKLLEAV